MKTNIQRIIINHMNAGNLELHGICVNELVKDIESVIPVDQEQIEEPGLFFIDENGPTKEYTTECDGEPEPGEVLTDKGIYFDNES